MSSQLNVKMKFRSSGCFKVVPLNCEGSFKALWASVRHSNAPSMDIFVEVSTSQIVTPTPTISLRLDDVAQFVSLQANDINEGEFDGNLEGDEFDEEFATLDENLIVIEEDGDDDLVFASAPIVEFNKVDPLDEDELNSWKTWESMVRYEKGKEFAVGQVFTNKASISDEVTFYSVQANQFFKVAESKPDTVTYKCGRSPSPCNWRLRATRKDPYSQAFTIVTYKGPHDSSCVGDMVPRDHFNLKRAFISHLIRNYVEGDWGYKVMSVVEVILDKFGYKISYAKAWNAKQRAIGDIFGDWDASYEMLPRFMQGLKESNPGTVVQWSTTPIGNSNVHTFKRVFWAFKPCIEGFEHCRPVLTIDGTHLYGKFKGTILTAMSIDANNQIFPVAFAIVESENNESWSWFMACIRLFVTKRSGLCVISDRHAGIMNAMSEVGSGWEEPHAFHRICIRHLASNVNTRYKNVKVKNMFGSTAMQFQEKKFDIGFARLGEMDRDAQHYVADVGIEKWSICHDGGHRYGILTTNLAEAFNNVLKGARFLPITALVQCIFFRVNAYFVERREEARKRLLQGQHYSSKITHLLEENCKKGAYHKVVSFDHVGGLYQVTTRRGSRNVSRGSHSHTVDLSKRTCTCNKFQTYKYPCSHVYAVCKKMKLNASQFVEISYTTGEHLASYASKFHPLKDEAYWGHYNGPRIVCDEGKRRGKGSMEYRLQPGPVNPEVLTQQETHRSKAIWDGDDKGSLRCRSHLAMHKGFLVSDRVVDFIRESQFYFIHRVVGLKFNVDFITALVERWRPETHTFHLTVGEATVTLQDVQVLLGLRIRGDVVTGSAACNWRALIYELLGQTPGEEDLKGASLRIGWLTENFSGLPEQANEQVLHQYVRAYLLILMATVMFPDKSGNDIQVVYLPLLRDLDAIDDFSWGSAVLATLYRNLCRSSNMKARDIGGPLILLQLWAWERITIARPIVTGPENPPLIQGPYPLGSQHQLRVDSLGRRWLSVHRRRPQGTTITTLLGYRDALDNMRPDQFVWQPYPQAIFSFLPEACYNDSGEWCVVSPMICFDIVEWHLPNRVARQFGWKQNIPEPADTEPKLHKMDKRGAHSRNWAEYHSAYLAMWFRRYQFRFIGVEDNSDMGYNDPYMVWYRDRTRRFISPTFQQAYQAPLGATAYLAHGFAEVHRTCNTEIQAMPQEVPPHYRNIMSNIRDNTSQSLEHVGYSHLLQQFHQPTQETQVEEQHEERGDGSTMQESTSEDDETLQVFRRRSRRTNTSMSPINEQGTPEPSKAKKIWSRLRGKKKT
ncbi:hypothetical protein KSS87_013902 [Heliosperma pusillum]|nr:hypothetical protein KSS87_013902 [Heliosperma pusillum]